MGEKVGGEFSFYYNDHGVTVFVAYTTCARTKSCQIRYVYVFYLYYLKYNTVELVKITTKSLIDKLLFIFLL